MLEIKELIINWYHLNKRDLPWRTTKKAYIIWLSEIILQQTRVEQGLPYFHKFLQHYPSVSDLAVADEQEILNDWQGLPPTNKSNFPLFGIIIATLPLIFIPL